MSKSLPIRAQQKHGSEYLALRHLFDNEQVSGENIFEAVAAVELGNHVRLAKLQRLLQSGGERHPALFPVKRDFRSLEGSIVTLEFARVI